MVKQGGVEKQVRNTDECVREGRGLCVQTGRNALNTSVCTRIGFWLLVNGLAVQFIATGIHSVVIYICV